MARTKSQRIFAFIDSQNLNVSTQRYGWKMDWRKFRKYLKDKHGVTKAFMFIGYVPEFEDMYEFLHDAGYAVVLKPTFDMSRPRPEMKIEEPTGDSFKSFGEKAAEELNGSSAHKTPAGSESDKKPVKGNVDAELVLWSVKEMPNYDKAVVVSGDGDFFCLVEYLDEKNKLGKLLTPTGLYSSLFKPYEKYIERIDQSRRYLAYRDKKSFTSKRR